MTALRTISSDAFTKRQETKPALGLVTALAWAAVTTVCIMVLTIAYSGSLSENFSDLTTGTMAFVGFGDKAVEIYGAAAAVVLGAIVGLLKAPADRHGSTRTASEADAAARLEPKPIAVLLVLLLAIGSAALALRTALAALGVESGTWAWLGVAAPCVLACLSVRGRTGRSASVEALLLLAGQASFGCAALALLPAPSPHDGQPLHPWTTLTAWSSAAVLMALVFVVGIKRVKALKKGAHSSPWALVNGPGVVVVAVALSATATPPQIPWDGYHFGELVSPAYLASAWGQMPFVDQFPARGVLVNYVPSWVSDVVAGPGASLVALGHAWLSLGLVASVYALVKRRLPVSAGLLVTAATAFAASNLIAIGDVAMLLSIALLHRIAVWRLRVAWPFAAALALATLLAAPAQGGACALCLAIVIVTHSVARQGRPTPGMSGIAPALVVVVAAIAIAPLRQALLSAVGYVTSQGSVNDQVWGTPWLWSLEVQAQASPVTPVLELVRAAVLPLLAVIGTLVLIQLRGERLRAPAVPLSLAALTYLCLQLPRALGRIDPDGISRVGALTLVAVGIALPLVASEAKWFTWSRVVTLSTALVVVPLIIMDGGLAKSATFISRAAWTTDATAGGTLVRSPANFGSAMIDPMLQAEYLSLSKQLQQLPGVADGLLDLTNQQSDFRYLGVSNALSYGAAYNITSRAVETSEVTRLESHPPRVALLTTNLSTWHDGGSFGLRNPILYRWVLRRYTPVQCGQPGAPGYAIWGTSDGNAPRDCVRASTPAEKRAMFDRAFTPATDLGALARSWGANRADAITATALQRPQQTPVTIRQGAGTTDAQITSLPAGDRRDVLTLALNCGGWTTAVVSWYDPVDGEGQSVQVQLGGGRAVLPMGTFPGFALRPRLLDVHVLLQTTSCSREALASWSEHAPNAT